MSSYQVTAPSFANVYTLWLRLIASVENLSYR